MFEQYVGDGANLFIAIVAVVFGFAKGMAVLDIFRTTKDDPQD